MPRTKAGVFSVRPVYVVILLIALVLQVALIRSDALDLIYLYSRAHEDYELDELFTVFIVASLALLALLVVRARDLRREVERRVEAEQAADRLARHDSLTGIPNRRLFQEEFTRRIAQARTQAQTREHRLAMLMLDLDRFKSVNDSYGHAAGDQLLQIVADKLKAMVRKEDFVARFGGDEFAVLVGPWDDDDELFRIAQRILTAVSEPLVTDLFETTVTVSIGIAVFPGDGATVEALMQSADWAMYQAKASGRNTYSVFDEALGVAMRQRLDTEAALRTALKRNEIVPYYQPEFDLATGAPIGVEALARWHHPTRGTINAENFITIAEDAGLITDIFTRILRQATLDAVRWKQDLVVSVNISPSQFSNPRLAETILAILAETGFPPERLEIEVTESALVVDLDAARATLVSLKSAGIRIALDDFGTGYSSLRHLHELPFDKIKIDKSFVQKLTSDEESRKIVASIIGLGQALELVTVAEGVDSPEAAAWIEAHGCDVGQGFLFSYPVPADTAAALLNAVPPADARETFAPPRAGA